MSKEKVAVVIDEFQYVANKEVLTKLQRLIDEYLVKTNLKLVLSGSLVSFFTKEALGYESPLFGRRTSSRKLKPLTFFQARGLLPKDCLEALKVYGIVGGTPAYLKEVYGKSFEEAIETVLDPLGNLYDEPENVFRTEVREPRTYLGILKAVAEGRVTPNEISNVVGVDPSTLKKYLEVMEAMDIVRRERSLGSKKGYRVKIIDPFFSFWAKFSKYSGLMEIDKEKAIEIVKAKFDMYMGEIFEEVVRQSLPLLYSRGLMKTFPAEIGKWWHKGEEIDLVALGDCSSAFIEVKWGHLSEKEVERIKEELKRKAEKSGLKRCEAEYLVVAPSCEGDCISFCELF